jgi:site-specific DNA-methyltransferase (adenine-specific)
MKVKDIVTLVSPSTLIPNKTKLDIYQNPSNYYDIKKNIQEHGILEPLLVNRKTNVIISGNMRLKIALELGMPEIPVILKDVEEKEMDIKSVSTNQQRVKSYFDILKEIEFFEQHYKIKKGQRTDLNPDLKELKEKRDSFLREHSRTMREKVKAVASLAADLYGKETEEYKGIFNALDNQKTTLNGLYQHLLDKTRRKQNAQVIPEKYEIIRENTKIYNHSSEDMYEVKTGSIHAIITSPPYLQMRDYGNGENELGQEKEIDLYLLNLMRIFRECHRLLRDDGSLFVNINDCVLGGQYQAVPHYFVIEMLKLGFILNDELLWIKQNPVYTKGKRSVRSHEPIFHFVKSPNFYYNDEWLQNLTDKEDKITYGINKTNPKVKSGMDFREGVLSTNVANTGDLRKKCKEEGFHLTHSATFPIDVPAICGLLTTRDGDTILDCFAGTSTVGLFARSNNRKFIGYDMNPEFIKASEVRIGGGLLYMPPNLAASEMDIIFSAYTTKKEIHSAFEHLISKIQPISPKLKKSFGLFTKAYNDCSRISHQKN